VRRTSRITLALLGERPLLNGDRGRGRSGIPAVARPPPASTPRWRSRSPAKFCASFFCSTDRDNNQIASFYTGAMADAGQLSFRIGS